MSNQDWTLYIGDITQGRKNLGEDMPVVVYRLLEFTLKETLIEKYGKETAVEIFRDAGFKAGRKFTKELLDVTKDFNSFIADLQSLLKDLKIGILRIEEADETAKHLVVTVGEDLDCSGLPITGEAVCNYDEGFLKGVLKEYTNNDYDVLEIDCWAKGGRVCRFTADMN